MRFNLLLLSAIAGCLVGPSIGEARAAESAAVTALIDHHIDARLEAEGISRAARADDAEFLRRVYLDLHGVVPAAEQAAAFLERTDDGKRAELIDDLLADPRFGEHFADLWRKALISPLVNEQRQQTDRFTGWLAERFNANDGWDRIVYDLLTASGKMEDNPAVTYLIEGRHPLGVTDLADLSSRYFLGVRLNCAQCHDHPFTEMKRNDYWGMASFFAQIQTPNRPKMVYMAGLRDDPKMTMAVLRDADMIEGFQPVPPTFLGGEAVKETDEPLRQSLARWMTAAENPYFARAMTNRIWWHFFGRGIVTPVDDMHSANEPSHPELLAQLSRDFADSGFDLKRLCRAVLNSRTYQATSRPGEQPEREAELFARMSIKVLTAEQLYDSLTAILGPPAKSPSIVARFGARHEFGQAFAATGDPEPTRYDRGIPHVLRLMNSPQFAGGSLAAFATKLARSARSTDDAVDELYRTILTRLPTADERKYAAERLNSASVEPADAYREWAWALLLGSEFSLNH